MMVGGTRFGAMSKLECGPLIGVVRLAAQGLADSHALCRPSVTGPREDNMEKSEGGGRQR